MSPAPAGGTARETAERVKLLFEFSPQAYLAAAALAIATATFLFDLVPRLPVTGWAACVALIYAARYGLCLAYRRRSPTLAEAPAWERRFAAGAALTGFAWAALPVAFFPERSSEMQIVMTFIVAVVAMGGTASLGPSRRAFAWFLAPMAIAMIGRLFLQGGSIFFGIGIVSLFYVALLARIWGGFHKALLETIRARFENEALIAKLRASEEMLNDAVESLPEAIAIYDADDRLLMCNRKYAAAQTAGDDPTQLVGKSFAELVRLSVAKGEEIEPEYAGNLEAWIAERIRRRQREGPPHVYRIADGRWMLTSISRTRAGGIVAMRTDITQMRQVEASLKAALTEQELIFEGVTTGISFVKDRVIQRCNRRLAEIFGCPREELIGQSSRVFYDSGEEWERIGAEAYPLIGSGRIYQNQVRARRRSGEVFWMQITGRLIDPGDEAKGTIWVIDDVDARHRTEEALREALIEEQRIMDTATVGIVFLQDRKVVKCNRQFASLFAYSPEELVGHSSAIWFPSVENWEKMGQDSYGAVERGEPYEFEQEFVRKNGERIWCHVAGRILDPHNWQRGSIWVYTDMTESKRREAQARDLAHHDALTGLPNRRLLDDRLSQALAAARRARHSVAVMLLDLDRFKPINDAYGHEAGDEVLKVVAHRLKSCVREADTVARVGGDEFVVMLAVRGAEDAARVAEKILVILGEPIPIPGDRVEIGCSIGISLFPDDAPEKEELLKRADRSMYHAKAAGRNCYRFYEREPAGAQAGIG